MIETTLLVWQKALAEIGTRSTITSSDITNVQGGSTTPAEAWYCNTFYNDVITQAIRAAHWNFCKMTRQLVLWKALPGTPENQTQPQQSGWQQTLYPAPPWTYSYVYPSDCIQVRSILGQPQQIPLTPPIFSGTFQLAPPPISSKLPSGRFEVATDSFDAAGNFVNGAFTATAAALSGAGTGYTVGDLLNIPDSLTPSGYSSIIVPAQIQVTGITGGGATGPINTAVLLISSDFPGAGYFRSPLAANPVAVTGGTGTGATFNITYGSYGNVQKVILTNLEQALIEFSVLQSSESEWDPDFIQVIVSALAGKLAIPLTGDKALARDKLNLANNMILEARVRDANEGLTINDHIPDWLRTRGVGGGLGYEMYFYPFGPLFPISPLV